MKALALLAAAPALLSADLPASRINSDWPPERFRGDGVAVVIFTSDIPRFCGNPPAGYRFLGCQREVEGLQVIVVGNPCSDGALDETAKITCHELAHRNGWSADHEQ